MRVKITRSLIWILTSTTVLSNIALRAFGTDYVQIEEEFSKHGGYDICHNTFAITTCQDIYPSQTGICTGSGGYERNITAPLTSASEDMTICCSPDESDYNNVTAFAPNLRGKHIRTFTTIGCDFTGAEGRFLSVSSFQDIVVKAETGTRELEIDTQDDYTKIWMSNLTDGSSTTPSQSDFHIEWELFRFRDEGTRIAKSFSFVSNEGTADITTVAYYGT